MSLIPQSEMSTEEAGAYVSALIGLGTDEETNGACAAKGRLLNDVQVWYAADSIPSGTMAGVALIEHRWAIPLRSAIVESGGEVLADAWIIQLTWSKLGCALPSRRRSNICPGSAYSLRERSRPQPCAAIRLLPSPLPWPERPSRISRYDAAAITQS